jgi:hypothetical protein
VTEEYNGGFAYVRDLAGNVIRVATLPELQSSTTVSVLLRSVTFTDAQIKTMDVTPIEIVPDPGEGRIVDFVRLVLVSDIVQPYTNLSVNADLTVLLGQMQVAYISNDAAFANDMLEDLFESSGVVLVGPASDPDTSTTGTGATQPIGTYFVDDFSGPLSLKLDNAAGALAGGDAGNTLKVITLYTIIDV